jgi:hypothetical protein
MRDLFRTSHYVVTVHEDIHVIRRTRTTVPFESLAQVEEEYAGLLRALETVDRKQYGQLIDARESPPRNDPAFESMVARYHSVLYSGFRAVAVLVKTAAGRLQVKRMLEASHVVARVFTEEVAALAYLSEGAPHGASGSRQHRKPIS